jgi:hypothetical protein
MSFNRDDIVDALRSAEGVMTPIELAELLDELTEGGLSEGMLVKYFKLAFPAIPLRVMRDACRWKRVSGGGLTDEAFNELLRPWLKGGSGSSPYQAVKDDPRLENDAEVMQGRNDAFQALQAKTPGGVPNRHKSKGH